MATREENIKKINDELEKLDNEKLEQVAGGWATVEAIDQTNQENQKKPNPSNGPVGSWISK